VPTSEDILLQKTTISGEKITQKYDYFEKPVKSTNYSTFSETGD
jgi:hypothetical protein